MKRVFLKWIERYFSNEEALLLFILLTASLVVILTLGGPLAPVFAGLILAFLMQGAVSWLQKKSFSHIVSVNIVFTLFFSALLAFVFIVVPLAWKQLAKLFNDLPFIFQQIQSGLLVLPEHYPEVITEAQIKQIIALATKEIGTMGQWILTYSFNSLGDIIALLIYFVLVPILVFFFLKDGKTLVTSWTSVLPHKREMMTKVWYEMDVQIANYIRGKTVEIFIVGVVTYLGFVVYGVIQALDGNVLVPLLFSEAVNLHPISIIIAVLIFGTLWGFWGVFFAIPLATLVKAILSAWPKPQEEIE